MASDQKEILQLRSNLAKLPKVRQSLMDKEEELIGVKTKLDELIPKV